jgi:hypothetical protein
MPNAEVSEISLEDNYGGEAKTVEVKGLDGKKVKSTITVTNKEGISGLEISGEQSKDKISEYRYLNFQGDQDVVQKLNSALVTLTADNKVLYINKESKKTFATFPILKGDDDKTTLKEQGYRVNVEKLKDEVKAEHFYHLFSTIPEGPGAVNQSMIHDKFDKRFNTYKATPEGEKALKGSIIDGRFHKVSANESMLTFATEDESLPPAITEIRKTMLNYLSGVQKIYDTMDDSTKSKIAGELGTDRFMVEGWKDFDITKSENPATLKLIDGDGKEVKITFKIKSGDKGDISLDPSEQIVDIAGVKKLVKLIKEKNKLKLKFVAPQSK